MKNEHATKPYLTEPEKFVLRIGWAEDGRYWIWKFDQIPWASLQEKGIIVPLTESQALICDPIKLEKAKQLARQLGAFPDETRY